jgi:hypothetical protein
MSSWNPCPDFKLDPPDSPSRFRGRQLGGSPNEFSMVSDLVDLNGYAPGTVNVSWEQWETGSLESSDGLYFAFYNDDTGWSANIEAFSNDIGSSPQNFTYTIPDAYLTSSFRMRFYLANFGGTDWWGNPNEYCYIDNIEIFESLLVADDTAIFKIDGTQVYFDGGGVPQQGAQEIIADSWQVVVNESSYLPGTYFYSSKKDVTELIRAFSQESASGNYPGNATYTVGGVDATWDASSEIAYAGWSLIIIYSSAETQGHQLYLFDTFVTSGQNNNLDFDNDGQPGGTISGFLVPDPIAGEVNAAKLTCFVGEGDDYYNGDYLAVNGTKLWDGTEAESLNDVWNAQSLGMSADGVDVDTFYVTWESDILEPGDTSAQIDLWTNTDIWEKVYIIISFRSETTSGGAITYLVRE